MSDEYLLKGKQSSEVNVKYMHKKSQDLPQGNNFKSCNNVFVFLHLVEKFAKYQGLIYI